MSVESPCHVLYLHRERLTKARAIASVLFEVLDTVSRAAGVQVLFM